MRRMRRHALLLLVLTLCLSLVGLTGTATGQAVKNPDTLIIQTIGDAETLDPSQAYDTASSFAFLWTIYETLIFFSGGRTDQYVPMLATEVPSLANGGISKDGRTYTFKIRQGVKFHDGSTMTPDDVKYSLMRFMLIDPDGGPASLLLQPFLGFTVDSTRDGSGKLIPTIWDQVDRAIQVKGDSVVMTLKAPAGAFLNILATWSMVVSKKFVVQNGGWDGTKATLERFNNPKKPEELTLFSKASGTGPFKLEGWDRATGAITLVRNDQYWRAPAKLARVLIRKVEEFGPRRLALQNGDADIIEVDRANQPAVTGIPGVRIVDDLARLRTDAIYMNVNINTEGGNPDIGSGRLDGNGVPPNFFSDVRVRRAFAHLFDRDRWVREAQRGKGRVAVGPIPFGLLGYNPKGKWYEVSRERAIAEFREAHGGQVWDRGFKLNILFNTGNISRQTAAQMLKEAIEGLNPKFQVDVRGVTWSSYLGQMRSKKLPVFIVGWVADYADPDNFAFPFMHSGGIYPSRQNYKNPEADKLVEAASKETDSAKRQQIYFQLQELAFKEVPTIYLSHSVSLIVMRSWVRGWYHNPMFFSTNGYVYTLSKQ